MIIAHNIAGLNIQRNMTTASVTGAKASDKLSSGYRINRAADDAAGLAISEKMRAQIKGLNQALRNVGDGISLVQTMDGGMSEITKIMQRERQLIIQSLNDTNTTEDKENIKSEITQLTAEITSTATKTEFNTIPLLCIPEESTTTVTTTPGYWKKEMVYGVTPTTIYQQFKSDGSLYAMKAALEKTQFRTTGYDTFFTYSDGTTLEEKYFNLESYLLPGFEELVTKNLFSNPKGSADYEKDAQDFADQLAAALTEGYQDAFNDEDIEISGSYDPGTDEVTFTISNSSAGNPVGMDALGCSINMQSNDFTHTFIHTLCSPSGAVTVNDQYPDYEEDVWVPPVTQTITSNVGDPIWIHSGANENQGLWVGRYDCRASSLGVDPIIIDPRDEAEKSLEKLDAAINEMNSKRATAGAQQNRMEHIFKNLGITSENLTSAESRIRDADMAKEILERTKADLLFQAGTAMMAVANQTPQSVLQLLG